MQCVTTFLHCLILFAIFMRWSSTGAESVVAEPDVGHESCVFNDRNISDAVRSVLIIGIGGELGSHVAYRLLRCGVEELAGIDNYNALNSPAMKRHRVQALIINRNPTNYSFTARTNSSNASVSKISSRSQRKTRRSRGRDVKDGGLLLIDHSVCNVNHALVPVLKQQHFTHVMILSSLTGGHSEAMQSGPMDCFQRVLASIHTNTNRTSIYYTAASDDDRPHQSEHSSERNIYRSSITNSNVKSSNDPIFSTRFHHHLSSYSRLVVAKALISRAGNRQQNSITALEFPSRLIGPWLNPESDIFQLTGLLLREEFIDLKQIGEDRVAYSYADLESVVDGILIWLARGVNADVLRSGKVGASFTLTKLQMIRLLATEIYLSSTIAAPAVTAVQAAAYGMADITDATTTAVKSYFIWYRNYTSSLLPCACECHDGMLCFASAWDAAAVISRRLTDGCRKVFYTVATGAKVDALHPIGLYSQRNESSNPLRYCNIAFVNRDSLIAKHSNGNVYPDHTVTDLQFGNWRMVLLEDFSTHFFHDFRKPSRVPKISPKNFFAPSTNYAIYMDSKLRINCNPMYYVNQMGQKRSEGSLERGSTAVVADTALSGEEEEFNRNKRLGILAVRAPVHHDVFADVEFVFGKSINLRPDITYYPQLLLQQSRAYQDYAQLHKMSMVNLLDGGFLIHDLRLKSAQRFRCLWYEEYQRWADRDQISAAFALSVMERSAGVEHSRRSEYILIGREEPSAPAEQHPYRKEAAAGTDEYENTAVYARLMHTRLHWRYGSKIATLAHFGWNG